MRHRLFIAATIASVCVALMSAVVMALSAYRPTEMTVEWHPLARGYTLLAAEEMSAYVVFDRPLDVPAVEYMSPSQRKAWFNARRPRAFEAAGFHLFLGEVVITGAFNIKHYDYRLEVGFPLWASLALGCVLPVRMAYRALRRRRRMSARRCLKCGYDLRASPEQCPECGTRSEVRANQPLERTVPAV